MYVKARNVESRKTTELRGFITRLENYLIKNYFSHWESSRLLAIKQKRKFLSRVCCKRKIIQGLNLIFNFHMNIIIMSGTTGDIFLGADPTGFKTAIFLKPRRKDVSTQWRPVRKEYRFTKILRGRGRGFFCNNITVWEFTD